MKATTLALRNLLATGTFVRADIWTITLNGGVVVRWTSHDQPISWAGQTYALGPIIQRGKISEKLGLQVSTLDVTITALDSDLINGSPIIGFIAGHGLDGASVKLERAYLTDWNLPIVGTIIRFAGRVTSVRICSRVTWWCALRVIVTSAAPLPAASPAARVAVAGMRLCSTIWPGPALLTVGACNARSSLIKLLAGSTGEAVDLARDQCPEPTFR